MSRTQRRREEEIKRQRADLAERLEEARWALADQAVVRIQAMAAASTWTQNRVDENVQRGVLAGIDLAIDSVREAPVIDQPLPAVLMTQTRKAAESDLPLSDLHQRFFAVVGLIAEELFVRGISFDTLRVVMRDGTSLFHRLIDETSTEYATARAAQLRGDERIAVNRIKAILRGEAVDANALNYSLQAIHVGIAGIGKAAAGELREMASALGLSVLTVEPQIDIIWSWIAARDNLEATKVTAFADRFCAKDNVVVGFGEPAVGLSGFRRTHREARAALHVAQRRRRPARYAQVALLAAVLKDDLLVSSLRERFLGPMELPEDGGQAGRETVRAYFAAGHNVSSAATALNQNRSTVKKRLSRIEKRLGQSLRSNSGEIEAAVLLGDLFEPEEDEWLASPE